MRSRPLLIATLACFCLASAHAAPATQPGIEPGIDKVLQPWTRSDAPGCAVSVSQSGRVVFERGYGMADLEQGVANRPDTVFNIASLSKQFTSVAILLLAEQGKLSLDDDVRKYVPEVPDYGTKITLRQLANHTSGLRDAITLLSLSGWNWVDDVPEARILDLVKRQKSLNFEPGSEYLYSNTGYELMATIVERISGQPLGAFADANIFRPLGMLHTRFYDDRRMIMKNRAMGYLLKDDGTLGVWRPTYQIVGDGAVLTTVQDLAIWERNFLAPRLGQQPQQLVRQLTQPARLSNGKTIEYALGVEPGEYRGLKTISHSGGIPGYATNMLRFPEQQLGIYVLCNRGGLPAKTITQAIADLYLDGKFKGGTPITLPIEDGARKPIEAAPKPAAAALVALEEYAGRYYSDELDTYYLFKAAGSKLVLTIGYLQDVPLLLVEGDRFSDDDDLELAFSRDSQKRIDGFSLSAGRVKHIPFQRIEKNTP